jgi:hypothetical protein
MIAPRRGGEPSARSPLLPGLDDQAFYSVAAQVIPVLFLALVFGTRLLRCDGEHSTSSVRAGRRAERLERFPQPGPCRTYGTSAGGVSGRTSQVLYDQSGRLVGVVVTDANHRSVLSALSGIVSPCRQASTVLR